MSSDLKGVVHSYVDAFNRGDLDAVCSCFAPDALIWGVAGWGSLEVARPVWRELIEAWGMQLRIEGLIQEGEVLAARFTESGAARGSFRGLPATGKRYEVSAMEWFVMHDGLIHRRWGARDFAAISRQLGLA